ncbi:MAG: hypothetical protein ACO28P_10600 [Ilumatobacteraceae bacterium]
MPARRKTETVGKAQRRTPTRTSSAEMAPTPTNVVSQHDDERVIELWQAAASTYEGRLDAQGWTLVVGAIEVARVFYATGSVAAWAEYRRTIKDVDHIIGQTQAAGAKAAAPSVIRIA